jgi:hypothetical protein
LSPTISTKQLLQETRLLLTHACGQLSQLVWVLVTVFNPFLIKVGEVLGNLLLLCPLP